MKEATMKRLRPIASVVLALYIVVHGVLLFTIGDPGGESGVEWVYVIPVVTAALMGLFLSVRRPDNAVGLLISLTGAALVTLGGSNYLVPRAIEEGNELHIVIATLFSDGAWITYFLSSLVLLPLWFPTGAPISGRWAWVGRVAVAAGVIGWLSFVFAESVCTAFDPPESSVCVESVPIPWGIEGFAGFESLFQVAIAMALPAVVSVFVRWRRSVGVERQQLKWVLLASTAVALTIVLSFDSFQMPQWFNDSVSALALAGLWVAIAVAILRYRLYEIDRIISRTVSYALVIGVLGLVVLGLVTLLATFAPSDDPLVVAISTLVVAALFNPVRRRVQAVIDRRFNRSRYDAQRVVGQFTATLQEQVDPGEVVDGWMEVVEDTMQPASVGVWMRSQ